MMKLFLKVIAFLLFTFQVKGEESHLLPFLLSTALPGGGQFYNGKYLKGAVYMTVEASLLYGAYIQNKRLSDAKDASLIFLNQPDSYEYKKSQHEIAYYKKERDSFIWLTAACVLLSGGDAFVDSYFADFKRDKFSQIDIIPQANGLALVYNF